MKKHDDFIYVLKYHVVFRSYYNTYTKKLSGSDIQPKKISGFNIIKNKLSGFHVNTKKYLTPNKIQSPPPPGYQMGRPLIVYK